MNKKNEYQDEGLKGNERIEDAIFALQKEATQEQLAHTLTVIRRRMKAVSYTHLTLPTILRV